MTAGHVDLGQAERSESGNAVAHRSFFRGLCVQSANFYGHDNNLLLKCTPKPTHDRDDVPLIVKCSELSANTNLACLCIGYIGHCRWSFKVVEVSDAVKRGLAELSQQA